jgi:CII-binding regulator of phage lambda lysogenization HflD
MIKNILKKLSGEEKLLKVIEEKDSELNRLRFNVLAWQRIHEEDIGAIRASQNEITGLRFQLDKKDTEIEDLKLAIQEAAS